MMRPTRRRIALTAFASMSVIVLAACSNSGANSTEFTVLSNVENEVVPAALDTLAAGACADENEALPLKVDTVPQNNSDQQIQLLAGQGGLPNVYTVGTPQLAQDLAESGSIADLSAVFDELDIADDIEPAALSTIEALYGDFLVLPTEYNVEGIWYNKALFADNGVELPQTWDELVEAAGVFSDAGLIPFAASGEQGWPITRLIGNYIVRELGPDALQKVADGEAELTDPEYVAAAQAVADLGAAGYFSQGISSIDYDTSINQFLNGTSPMLYMGSWVLSNFNDPSLNQIGDENIGFLPFPDVAGGAGDSSQLVANVGQPFTITPATAESDEGKAWLECIAENYGSVALGDSARISGFAVNQAVEVGELTQLVQDQLAQTDTTVPWFEALFTQKATTTSQTNAAPLVTGDISAEDFMALVQGDLQ